MKILRVFPRKTNATPVDDLSVVGEPPALLEPREDVSEIHVSVAFTFDIDRACDLAELWTKKYPGVPVLVGGPGMNHPGGDFVPGRYLANGYVITSRGCPNNCWFCSVPSREGRTVIELPVTSGCNVLDDNLLACSKEHIGEVWSMLHGQKRAGNRVEFTGGLESARLNHFHMSMLSSLKPKQVFFAYDTPNDLEPLHIAGGMCQQYRLSRDSLRCYVLCGWPSMTGRNADTTEQAHKRMLCAARAGFLPMAMLYADKAGHTAADTSDDWAKLQRTWTRVPAMKAVIRRELGNEVTKGVLL